MRRLLEFQASAESLSASVVTIGKFLAIHRGHQALLAAAVEAARLRGVPAVALTFDRHPLSVLRPGQEFPELASLEERLELIEAMGVDVAAVVTATPGFLGLEAETFARTILAGRLGAREVLSGQAFRFGRDARGDVALLQQMGPELGFCVTAAPLVLDCGERISTSRILDCLRAGRVEEAGRLLGRPFSVPGVVVEGERVGRRLGFPTANVAWAPGRMLPAPGVYAGELAAGGFRHPAAVNLGTRPTRDGRRMVLEAHLPGWEGDLYGQPVVLRFLHRLRDERAFDNLEELAEAIRRDVERVRETMGTPGADSVR